MFDDLEAGDSDGEKKPQKEFKNKGKVHEDKQKNKRQQKEAKKNLKIGREKGIIDLKDNDQNPPAKEKVEKIEEKM